MADIRLYSNLKASLAQTVLNLLESSELDADPLYHLIQWDLANTHPKTQLPEVTGDDCKYRARVVITAVGDADVGKYVSAQIMRPIFVVTVYSKDPTASNYLLSVIKRSFDDLPIVRVTSIDLDARYEASINCHSGNLMLTLNLGSLPIMSGRSRCGVMDSLPSACPGLEIQDQDLTLSHP